MGLDSTQEDLKNFGGKTNVRIRGQEGGLGNLQVSVTGTAAILATGIPARNGILIKPTDGDIFIGDSGVTLANGYLISSGESLSISLKETIDLYAVSGGAVNVAILEVA